MRGVKRFAALLALLAALLLLTGCPGSAVQPNKFSAFKDAAAAVTTQSQAAYDEVQALWTTLSMECLAKPMPAEDYAAAIREISTKSPCKEGVGKNPKPRMDVRVKVLKALANYAAAVNTLASTDYVGGYDASIGKLDASFTSLESALADKNGLNLTVPAKAVKAQSAVKATVEFIGKIYLERERKKQLRAVLNEGQGSLDAMRELFEDSNMSLSNLEWSYQESFLEHRAAQRKGKDHDKLLAYDAKLVAEYTRIQEVEKVLAAQTRAIKAMPEANKALLESLDKDDPGILKNLERYIAAAQEVHDIVLAWKKL